jgi:hypothetical protein
LQPETIGIVLAGGTAVKLLTGPAAARVADRFNEARLVCPPAVRPSHVYNECKNFLIPFP